MWPGASEHGYVLPAVAISQRETTPLMAWSMWQAIGLPLFMCGPSAHMS
jgi:hypothetical protein